MKPLTLEALAINTIYKNNIPTYQLPPVMRRYIDIEYACKNGYLKDLLCNIQNIKNMNDVTHVDLNPSVTKVMEYFISENLVYLFKNTFELILDNKIEIYEDDYDEWTLAEFQFDMVMCAYRANSIDILDYLFMACKMPDEHETNKLHSHDRCMSIKYILEEYEMSDLIYGLISTLCVKYEPYPDCYHLLYVN